MTWLIFSDQTAARRFCAAVDRHTSMDYPRTHTNSEPGVFVGHRVRSASTASKTRLLHNGTQAAVRIDESVDALHGQVVIVSDGGNRSITIATSGAGITRIDEPSLPSGWPTTALGVNPWTDRPPRDGLGGSR